MYLVGGVLDARIVTLWIWRVARRFIGFLMDSIFLFLSAMVMVLLWEV